MDEQNGVTNGNENVNENENVKSEAEKFDERIETLENELAQARADFYNYRQRAVKERMEVRRRTQEDTIIEFLPVLDNLNRALDAAHSEDVNSIIKGVEMVQRQFVSVLENLGVDVIEAEGQNFDPSLHDAAETEQTDDPELDGKIISERLKGYRTAERVLRPSQVTVGKFEQKENNE